MSVDAELGWGFHDLSQAPTGRVRAGREGWRTLLDLFEYYELPATWGIVGHLFLSECDGTHPEVPAPDEWFACGSPDTVWDRHRFFAPDLVRSVVESPVAHDVGLHSFSHPIFGDVETSEARARAEVDAAVEAARGFGVDPTSFVFPRNRVDHRSVLADSPVTCYRGVRPDEGAAWKEKVRDAVLGARPPPLVRPTVDEYGLVNFPVSLYLFGFQGPAREVAVRVRTDPIVEGVDLRRADNWALTFSEHDSR